MMFRALLPGLPQRYGFAGLALGSLLPAAGVAAELISGRGVWTPIWEPFHAIVFSLPLVFGALFFLAGRDRARLLVRISAGEIIERELLHQALHDRLTGLPNRAALEHEAGRLASARAAGRLRPAFLLLDLDRFKTINDTLGHDAGDDLLVLFSARVEAVLGPQERLFRLGGDEFVVTVSGWPGRAELARVASVVENCADEPFELAAGRVTIGVSIGIAVFEAGDGMSDVMKRADTALYAAKGMPGSAHVFHEAVPGHGLPLFDIHAALEAIEGEASPAGACRNESGESSDWIPARPYRAQLPEALVHGRDSGHGEGAWRRTA